ncbi:Tol-Pal system protein TolB [Roseospira marina]|uniref:Tol-Pal system protein TolB n=1 Tax=Roseospira marina TaxID=140057 RepID=A0A5M6IEW7_9PROT|nr:Tol-Pal system beta propeller repeat protein TolB [Roseospira marina]KAA5606672.1 Tol-Pal system protein TolB [Roseospira marina]MBB4313918.1 TolB protein [Roseospira marina]MBB5087080.1 TolB protein [Roseospira marina]
MPSSLPALSLSRAHIGALLLLPVVIVLSLVMASAPAAAQVRIDITGGRQDPLPVAIPDFAGPDAASVQKGREVAAVIGNDLRGSGLFRILDPAAFIQTLPTLDTRPRFEDWRALKAQALVQGMAQQLPDGRLQIGFRLWDVFAGQQLVGSQIVTDPGNWRRAAHMVADEIYKALTGEEGYFDTRVVYIAETGAATDRVKRLAIMDQDGANNRYLTDGQALVLTPRFSPTAQEITYMSYYQGVPRVYLFNIDTGRRELLGNFPGMTFAPRFSPDGNRVIMSMAEAGNSELYVMDLRTRQSNRLTNNPAIDTSPSFSPDGKQVTFNSDRGGSQQLYVMSASGGAATRISFGDGSYATPVWSPRGDLIAFTKMKGGRFYIGVMKPDGSGERLLTEGYLVEGPTWAPNGRVLMFFREQPGGGGARLYSIDLTGFNERAVQTPTAASDPAWSPLLP